MVKDDLRRIEGSDKLRHYRLCAVVKQWKDVHKGPWVIPAKYSVLGDGYSVLTLQSKDMTNTGIVQDGYGVLSYHIITCVSMELGIIAISGRSLLV